MAQQELARFQLCEQDRKRFGCPEWMTLDILRIPVADLEELSERFGFLPTDWPDPFIGEIALEDAGDGAVPKRPRWRNRALAWMLLRQNGIDASWEDAGAVLLHKMVQEIPDVEPEPEPGKDSSTPQKVSGRSDGSTTRRSGTSTRSRRRT